MSNRPSRIDSLTSLKMDFEEKLNRLLGMDNQVEQDTICRLLDDIQELEEAIKTENERIVAGGDPFQTPECTDPLCTTHNPTDSVTQLLNIPPSNGPAIGNNSDQLTDGGNGSNTDYNDLASSQIFFSNLLHSFSAQPPTTYQSTFLPAVNNSFQELMQTLTTLQGDLNQQSHLLTPQQDEQERRRALGLLMLSALISPEIQTNTPFGGTGPEMEDVPVPLPDDIKAQLVVKKFHEIPKEFPSCVICQMDFEPTDEVKVLHCQHLYHPECIDQWFQKNTRCPICKHDQRETIQAANPTTGSPITDPHN